MIRAKPTRAKVKRPRAAAAASGLPDEVINWIPEMTIMMTVINPAMPRIIGIKKLMSWVIKIWLANRVETAGGLGKSTWARSEYRYIFDLSKSYIKAYNFI